MSWRSRLLRWAPLGVLVLTLGLLTLPSILAGPPAPCEHDEFGYLLSAETFRAGRLTNPTPRHWEHFETLHQTMRPSYQSKYPPAQALFLAAGMALGPTSSDEPAVMEVSVGTAAKVPTEVPVAEPPTRIIIIQRRQVPVAGSSGGGVSGTGGS